jgi:trans-AT polyketide synthase, acyltransferase and oxidoreductase domains
MRAYIFPGQGSQARGMGNELFDEYKKYTQQADEILGYSIKELCLHDPEQNLNNTKYTQPALFVVNALTYIKTLADGHAPPDYLAGHSLGEYNALFAANVIDFQTGLKLVKKRGELMADTHNGGMAAVLGIDEKTIEEIIEVNGLKQIEIANLNSPAQIVLSGDRSEIKAAQPLFETDETWKYIVLNVSGAFHSKFMKSAEILFRQYISQFEFSSSKIPVISNVLARPYPKDEVKELLSRQMTHPVKWMESIRYIWGKGVEDFVEIGPGDTLTKLIQLIKQRTTPLQDDEVEKQEAALLHNESFKIEATSLGCMEFKKDYKLKYAYATGGMANGISSKELVVKIGKAGMIGYFGTGSLPLNKIKTAILFIQSKLDQGQAYGMNLLPGPDEEEQVDLFLNHNVPNVEASAYIQLSLPLVKYKLWGLTRNPDGSTRITNRIMAKLSRPEVASVFLSPPPESLIEKLLEQGAVTWEQTQLARNLPMADDICVEADSAGHTDMGGLSTLMPAITSLRDEMMERYQYSKRIRIGAAGGIGTPVAAASAFILGADFILTGSINQCTSEAGTSNQAKDMLQDMNVQDTAYAPAGDMFEMGSKIQVLKRGLFFPARASKLYDLYRHYNSLEEIDKNTRNQLEKKYFKASFDDIYEECKQFCSLDKIQRADNNPKQKMAIIFKWYFYHSSKLALEGKEENKVDFQIYCGPALGAFNQWVKGTNMEKWQNRHIDEIAIKLLNETSCLLEKRFHKMIGNK